MPNDIDVVEPEVSPLRASVPSASNFYRTCKNCAFEPQTCDRRAALVAGVKGLGLTGVTFRCEQRQPFFRVGQRVVVTWKIYDPDWDGYSDGMMEELWPATVVAETKRGFRIVVDDVEGNEEGTPARSYIKSESLYCNVTAGRLRAIQEPDRAVCGYCGSAENGDGTVTGCWASNNGCDGMFKVDSCLAQAIEARRAATQSGSVHESAVAESDAP